MCFYSQGYIFKKEPYTQQTICEFGTTPKIDELDKKIRELEEFIEIVRSGKNKTITY